MHGPDPAGTQPFSNTTFAAWDVCRLKDTKITVFAVHPGLILTNIWKTPWTYGDRWHKVVERSLYPWFRTAEQVSPSFCRALDMTISRLVSGCLGVAVHFLHRSAARCCTYQQLLEPHYIPPDLLRQ